MRKSSRSISLALIGSALLLSGGCQPAGVENEAESEWGDGGEEWASTEPGSTQDEMATGTDQYNNQHHAGGGGRMASRIGGAMIGSQIGRAIGGGMSGRSGSAGGYAPSAGPSARGGFGSSGGFGGAST